MGAEMNSNGHKPEEDANAKLTGNEAKYADEAAAKPAEPNYGEQTKMTANGQKGWEEPAANFRKPLYKRRSCHICCGVSLVFLVIVVVVVIALIFTVFKVKDPEVTVDDIKLNNMSVVPFQQGLGATLDLDFTLFITVHNPNHASYSYRNGSVILNYHDQQIGTGLIPAGEVGALKTIHVDSDIHIPSLRIEANSNVTADLQSGLVPINTYSKLEGRFNALNIFKRHATTTITCDSYTWVTNATLKNFTCSYYVHL